MYLCLQIQGFRSNRALKSTEKDEGLQRRRESCWVNVLTIQSLQKFGKIPSIHWHRGDAVSFLLRTFRFPSKCQNDKPSSLSGWEKWFQRLNQHVCHPVTFVLGDPTRSELSNMTKGVKNHHPTSLLDEYTGNKSPNPWATSRRVHEKQNRARPFNTVDKYPCHSRETFLTVEQHRTPWWPQ